MSSKSSTDPNHTPGESFRLLWETLLRKLRLRFRQLDLPSRRQLQECLYYLSITASGLPIEQQSIDFARRISRTSRGLGQFDGADKGGKISDIFSVGPNPCSLPISPKDFEFHSFDVVQVREHSSIF